MKTFVTLFGIALFLHAKGYKQFPSENEEKAFCTHQMHYIVSPMSTCCNTSLIKPGINFDELWLNCTADPQDSAETVEKAAWAVYGCIVKEYNGGEDSITLTKFAELMTEQYPDDFKEKIKAEIASLDDVTADLTDSNALNKVRVSYFDVEREVCNAMPSTTKEYGKDRECMYAEEEFHRGGQCCEKISYPLDIGLQSYFGMDLTQKMDSCNKFLRDSVLKKVPDVMASNIVEMCDVTCEMIKNEKYTAAQLQINEYANVDFAPIADILMPMFLPSKVKNDAKAYAMSKFSINQTVEQIKEYEFPDAVTGNSSTDRTVHFIGYVDTNNTKGQVNYMKRKFPNSGPGFFTPFLCSAHKQILGFLQHYLQTMVCKTAGEPENKDSETDSGAGESE